MTEPLPVHFLNEQSRAFPGVWKLVDAMRESPVGADPDIWPKWCFLPIAGALACIEQYSVKEINSSLYASFVAALAPWRLGKGIYRFDETLYEAVTKTPIKKLPVEVFYRLPEWCLFIEAPLMGFDGFFVHLERDGKNDRNELRLLFIDEEASCVVPIYLERGKSVEECLEMATLVVIGRVHINITENRMELDDRVCIDAACNLQRTRPDRYKIIEGNVAHWVKNSDEIARAVSLVAYICSANAEFPDESRPANPQPKRTKKGMRFFPSPKPKTWAMGMRIGAAIRLYRQKRESGEYVGTGGEAPPHIRMAHWHGFWKGPRNRPDEREFVVHWLPPIPVNIEQGADGPAVLHPVKQ